MSRRHIVTKVTHISFSMAFRMLLILIVCTWTSLAEARLAGDRALRESRSPLNMARRARMLRRIREAREEIEWFGERLKQESGEPFTTEATVSTTIHSSEMEPTAQPVVRASCRRRRSKPTLNNKVTIGNEPGCKPIVVKLYVCQGRCPSVSYAEYSATNEGGVYRTRSACCQPTQMENKVFVIQCKNQDDVYEDRTVTLREPASCGCS